MGIFRALKAMSDIEKLYRHELKTKAVRDSIIAKGVTEDLLKELMRQAEHGVVAELSFGNGTILRFTRTNDGMETKMNGISFKESF